MRKEPCGVNIHLELVEVDAVETMALSDRPRELILVESAALEQDPFDRHPGFAGRLNCFLNGVGIGESQLDNHLAEKLVPCPTY